MIDKKNTEIRKISDGARAVMPKRAMILAAGYGRRLQPLTHKTPKALIKVGGRAMVDRSIDRLEEAGVETIVVNLHHLGSQLEQHLRSRKGPEILFSREDELLETGGGVRKALPLLGDKPFLVVNADVMWLNGPTSALGRMATIWDDATMDGLLLLHSTVDAYGYTGMGDFCIDADGLLSQRPERELSPYLFTGIQILHPRLFEDTPEGSFRLRELYDRAIENERLYGIVHDGEWFHVGTPEGLAEAERYLRARYPETKHR
ncbi:MAG: nucleotidyltransferase family protein [Hydrogenovibrio crunogenus]|nr:nucleotidyltransferase family protein [Hydrogenovibrio crunogenus]